MSGAHPRAGRSVSVGSRTSRENGDPARIGGQTLRAVIYARVSSQAQRDRHTISSQLRNLPGFVASRGWVLARPVDTYVDDGLTARAGHLEARDGFRRLLADAAARVFDVVVVVDLDRLTRSEDLAERGAVLGAFQKAGVQ